MKRKMLIALSVAVALTLAPISGHLVTTAAGKQLVTIDAPQRLADVSGNNGSVSGGDGSVSGNNGAVSWNDNMNIDGGGNQGGDGNQNANNNQNSGNQNNAGQSTSGVTVTVTTSGGTQITTTIPTSNTSSEVLSVAMITPQNQVNEFAGLEASNVQNGQYIALTVANSQCGQAAQQVINNAANAVNSMIATILEIDLGIFEQGGTLVGKVTDLTEPIQFTISAPSNISNPGNYDFALIRLHNGQADILPDMDDDPATITVETDGFSVYAVAYGEEGSFDAYRTSATNDKVPNTGSELPLVLPAAVAAGVALAITAIVVWKKKKEN